MRTRLTVALAATGLLAWVMPTLAADDQVIRALGAKEDEYGAVPNRFAPSTVTIAPGQSVTFANESGTHNVVFEDGQLTSPLAPAEPLGWPSTPARRTFSQAGAYRFYCAQHGAQGGVGMSGKVVVASDTPAPGPGAPPPPGAGLPGATPVAPRIEAAVLSGRPFCSRGRRCRRPGVRLKLDLSAPARVMGTLTRRPPAGRQRAKRFGTLDFGTVAAGGRQVAFTRTKAGRRLTAGRYVLTVQAGESTRVLGFSVR